MTALSTGKQKDYGDFLILQQDLEILEEWAANALWSSLYKNELSFDYSWKKTKPTSNIPS